MATLTSSPVCALRLKRSVMPMDNNISGSPPRKRPTARKAPATAAKHTHASSKRKQATPAISTASDLEEAKKISQSAVQTRFQHRQFSIPPPTMRGVGNVESVVANSDNNSGFCALVNSLRQGGSVSADAWSQLHGDDALIIASFVHGRHAGPRRPSELSDSDSD